MENKKDKNKRVTWDAFLLMTTGGAIGWRGWELDESRYHRAMGSMDVYCEKTQGTYAYYMKVKLTGSAEARETMRGGEWPDEVEIARVTSGQARAFDPMTGVLISSSMSSKSRRKIAEMWMAEQKALDEEERDEQ